MTGKRSALIVATSEYKDQRLAALEGPAFDAEALRGVLSSKDIGGFDVRVALNSRVDTLRRTLETFFADRARDDLLLLHFSGHGLKDDDGLLYLAAADTRIDRLLSTGVDAAWVNRLMNKCHSEKIALFLDCCFAGAFTSGMVRRAGVDTAGVKENFSASGLFVITASDAMQYSFEGGKQIGELPEPSPFTKALVDGLQTGEADRNEDGDVSINELFDYLEERIRSTSPSQTPTKSAFNQVGDWVIARSTRVPSVRLLPEPLQQQLKSEDALDRFGALIDLRDLIEGADPRLSEAAMQALEKLTGDDSRRVAATAQRLLEEELAESRSAARGSRRRAPPEVVEAAPIAPVAVAEVAVPDAVLALREAALAVPETVPAVPEAVPTMAEAVAEAAPIAPEAASIASSVVPPAPVAEPAPIAPAVVTPAPVDEPGPLAPAAASAPVTAFSPPPGPVPAAATFQAPVAPAFQAPVAPTFIVPPTPLVAPPPGSIGSEWVVAPSGRAAGATEARDERAEDGSWSFGPAAGRAAIGTFLWVLLQYAIFLAANSWVIDSPGGLEAVSGVFGNLAFGLALVIGAIVGTAEKFVPALRLPDGAVYRFVGGNRWGAAALLGAVTGLTIGLGVELAYLYSKYGSMIGLGPEIPFVAALGFVIAEAAVGRSSRRHREGPSQAT